MNPGPLLDHGGTGGTNGVGGTRREGQVARWCEYDARLKTGRLLELEF